MSSRAILTLLDELEAHSVECHSLMIVHRGQVVAEGWWTPYDADRPHLLYSLTKSFTSIAVGFAIEEGLLALDDRIVDVLPDHVPVDIAERGRRLTVHHLLSMTVGYPEDSLLPAWELEPQDLVKGFLRLPLTDAETHVYDNATTFILARMVERVTGRSLPELLGERLFGPMGIEHADWDHVGGGLVYGFHGLHLTTEAVAAFGELLRRGGVWGERRLVSAEWIELATRKHADTVPLPNWGANPDFLCGYGYQFWPTRHGFMGSGSWGQTCAVVPEHDLVVAMTATLVPETVIPGLFWDNLLNTAPTPEDDAALAERLRGLSLPAPSGAADPDRSLKTTIDASPAESALPAGTPVVLDPVGDGWRLTLGPHQIDVGHQDWRESSPSGRPIVARGAWQADTFTADLHLITSPHRVHLAITPDSAHAVWNVVPLTTADLDRHLHHPLTTRPANG
ncbi:serine hydrolase [Kribbella sandramycini]|nr:serine hydrolase [Kribbella sandramycini]